MVDPIPAGVRETWEEWKIKGPILASLYIQIMLVLIAPFRKRTGHKLVVAAVWSFYLLADGVALFALGQIFNVDHNNKNEFGDLAVFWSTFLLVHLGGPDTITAFSIADTQLWLRHFLQMIVQSVATFYLILLTLPSNKVVGPTVLLFIVGIVKYSERCVSLCLACRREIEKWVLSSTEFERLVLSEAVSPPAEGGEGVGDNVTTIYEQMIVSEALKFRGGTKHLAKYKDATDALRITEVVMNVIYENVYSKALVLHSGVWGYIFRFLTFSSTVAALCIFRFKEHHYYNNNNNGRGSDVIVTYVLLGGAILLEFYSVLMIIFSDWTFSHFGPKRNNSNKDGDDDNKTKWDVVVRCVGRCCGSMFLLPALRKLVSLKKTKWDVVRKGRRTCGVYVFRRWSGHVSRYNLTSIITCAAEEATTTNAIRAATIKPFAAVKDKFFKAHYDEWKYVSHEPLTECLWLFIYHHLRAKIDYKGKPANFKLLSGGSLAVKNHANLRDDRFIKLVIEDFKYGRNLLIWSIATDLLYASTRCVIETTLTLSDYMLYLLLVRQLWPLDDIIKRQLLELCGEYREKRRHWVQVLEFKHEDQDQNNRTNGYDISRRDIPPADIEDLDAPSTKLLDCGYKLAWILMEAAGEILERQGGSMESIIIWDILGSVWVEKLWMGGRRCSAYNHIELLSKGGELLTLVWLLSAKLDPDNSWNW